MKRVQSAYNAKVNASTVGDGRNLGGRIEIVGQVKRHHDALLHTKSVMNTQVPPRLHVNEQSRQAQLRKNPKSKYAIGDGKKKMKEAFDNEEKNICFRKIEERSKKTGWVDSKAPFT
jgi:hypothetical protein